MEGRDKKQHNFAIVIQIIGVEMLKHHRPTSHHTLTEYGGFTCLSEYR